MLIWLKNQRKVRYRTFQLSLARSPGPALLASARPGVAATVPVALLAAAPGMVRFAIEAVQDEAVFAKPAVFPGVPRVAGASARGRAGPVAAASRFPASGRVAEGVAAARRVPARLAGRAVRTGEVRLADAGEALLAEVEIAPV